jgi:hypothetical protein
MARAAAALGQQVPPLEVLHVDRVRGAVEHGLQDRVRAREGHRALAYGLLQLVPRPAQGLLRLLARRDVPGDPDHALHAARGIAERGLRGQEDPVFPPAPGGGLEGARLAGRDHLLVRFLVLPGGVGGEQLAVVPPQHVLDRPSEDLPEGGVREQVAAGNVLQEHGLARPLDHRAQQVLLLPKAQGLPVEPAHQGRPQSDPAPHQREYPEPEPVPHEPRFDRGAGGDRGPDPDQGRQQEGERPQGDEGEGAWARHRARGRGHGLASALLGGLAGPV